MLLLHLSDLHFGNKNRFSGDDHAKLGKAFHRALQAALAERKAPAAIDLVIVTGDIVESGLPSEFGFAHAFLASLAEALGLARDRFVFLPGNHDISWASCKKVRAERDGEVFPAGEFEERLTREKLANYYQFLSDFYGRLVTAESFTGVPHARPLGRGGWLRDFPELHLSVAGLNTSERENDEIKGGFLSPEQAQALMSCWREPAAATHLKILALHHNPIATTAGNRDWTLDWLRDKEKKAGAAAAMPAAVFEHYLSDIAGFNGSEHLQAIVKDTCPQLILHGHHHDQGSPTSWFWKQGGHAPVLSVGSFGLKADQLPGDAPLSCQVLQFILPPEPSAPRLVAIPLVYDGRFRLEGELLEGAFRAEANSRAAYDQALPMPAGWRTAAQPPPPGPSAATNTHGAAAAVTASALPLLFPHGLPSHPHDPFPDTAARFIGREAQLGIGSDAVEGMLERLKNPARFSGGRAVQWLWAHGFGGMGKSWCLHRIRCLAQQAHPQIRSLIIDWDKPDWLAPLTGEPRTPVEVFDLIAIRLCQCLRLDETAITAYREAKARVAASATEHRRAHDRFEQHLQLVSTGSGTGAGADDLIRRLRDENLWHDDPARREVGLKTLRDSRLRHREVFTAWCADCGEVNQAVICPKHELAAGLRASLSAAMQQHPLIVVLDTCEILSDDLDFWLRELFAPLITACAPLLLLIGSRLRPDLHQPRGSRRGWLTDQLPAAARRIEDFGESLRFPVFEIEYALDQLRPPVAGDHARLAEVLHRATLGVPLAVRGLLDLHEAGDEVLTDLAATSPAADAGDDNEPLTESKAVSHVIATVCDRWLLNLENNPARADDLQDIIALALLPALDQKLMGELWQPKPVHARLRELSRKYSLLSDGDLHPTVRSYLRRHWRAAANRPDCLPQVLERLAHLHAQVSSLSHPACRAQQVQHRIATLNLRSWREGDAIVPALAPVLCLARVYEVEDLTLETLLSELPLSGPAHAEARKLWHGDDAQRPSNKEILPWLRAQRSAAQTWTAEEDAALVLLEGIAMDDWEAPPAVATAAFDHLEQAWAFFGLESLPLAAAVGEAYFAVGYTLSPYAPHKPGSDWVSASAGAYERSILLHCREAFSYNNVANLYKNHLQAEQCYLRAIELDPKMAAPHNGLGELYQHHLQQPEKAEQCYLRAIELDPKFAHPHSGLGNLYQQHLQQPEKAEQRYLRAIELDPKFAHPHHGLGELYQHHLQQPEKAEQRYLRAIELDPNSAYPHNGLGNLYQRHPRQPEKAEQCYLRAIELDPKFAYPHSGLGNLYQQHLQQPEKAEQRYLRAIELDPKFAHPHHGLGELYQHHLQQPEKAEQRYLRAIELDPNSAYPHNGLGDLYQRHPRQPEKAEQCYLRAIELDPKYAEPHNSLGNLHQYHFQQPEKAEGYYLRAIEVDPMWAYPHNGLGNLYQHHLQQPDKAKKCYQKAIELDPKMAAPHNGLGNLYQQHPRQPEKAEQCYCKAIELNPKYAHPHNGLGSLHESAGRWSQAVDEFQQGLKLDSKYSGGQRGLAWVALRSGADLTVARCWAEQALALNPKHPGNFLVEIAITAWAGDLDQALALWADRVPALPLGDEWFVPMHEDRFAALLRRVHAAGRLEAWAAVLRASPRPCWRPYEQAVDALLRGRADATLKEAHAGRILHLLQTPDPGTAAVPTTPKPKARKRKKKE